jgi:uncharacterized protein
MNLEKSLEISLLNDFYGKLLTQKQQSILVEYYYNNMSLAEIAENFGVTRQAVLDSLKKSEKQLKNFEEVLGSVKKHNMLKQHIESLITKNKTKTLSQEEVESQLKLLLNLWEGS